MLIDSHSVVKLKIEKSIEIFLSWDSIEVMIDTKQFEQYVYEIVRQIPSGKVISYGGVARLAGYPHHSRLVGRIMSLCPLDCDVPCHRVVNAHGSLSCVFRNQRELLKEEGVIFKTNGNVDMQACDILVTIQYPIGARPYGVLNSYQK